jgi:hypothetical protein
MHCNHIIPNTTATSAAVVYPCRKDNRVTEYPVIAWRISCNGDVKPVLPDASVTAEAGCFVVLKLPPGGWAVPGLGCYSSLDAAIAAEESRRCREAG